MNYFALDRQASNDAKNGTPHGYILANGVVVVYSGDNGKANNNMATLEHAMKLFPKLVILNPQKTPEITYNI